MKQTGIIAFYMLKQLLHQRSVIMMLFALPLLLIWILGTALSGYFGQQLPAIGTIRLAVLLEDTGAVKVPLLQTLKMGEAPRFELLSAKDIGDVTNRVRTGEADLGLYVPPEFSRLLQEGAAPVWELVLGTDIRKNMAGEQVIASFFDQADHQAAWGDLGNTDGIYSSPLREEDEQAGLVRMMSVAGEAKPYSALQYYAAHMLVMFMLYGGMSSAVALVEEKEKRTLLRLRSSPAAPVQILIGNVGGHFAIVMLQAVVIVAGSWLLYGVDWGDWMLVLLAACIMISAFTLALAAVLGIWAKSHKSVMNVYQPLIILMTFLSGGFSPSIGDFLSGLGHFTMNYWATQSIMNLMAGQGGEALFHPIAVLTAIAAVMCLLAAALFRRVGYHE